MTIVKQLAMIDEIPVIEYKIKDASKPKRKRKIIERETVARFLHLGAGVQSTTIVEMIVEGDLPPVDAVIFADTGNEPRHVYKNVAYLRKRLKTIDIPLWIVRKKDSKGIVKDVQVEALLRIATMPLYSLNPVTGKRAILRRQCTNEYKIIPCDNAILDFLIEKGYAKRNKAGARRVNTKVQVENIYGISADEKEREGKRGASWQKAVYPLILMNWGRLDCEDYLRAKGLPIPKKSACKICPYRNDEAWLWMSINTPDEFEDACNFDDWLRTDSAKLYGNFRNIKDILYIHQSCIPPLRSVDFKIRVEAKTTGQMNMFKHELMAGKTCSSDGGFTCFS